MDLFEAIVFGKTLEANKIIKERLLELAQQKLAELKIEIANEMFGDEDDIDDEELEEGFRGIDLGRERVVQYRFRHGKFQPQAFRSHANIKGYRVKKSHHTNTVGRQTPTEMQKRRLKMRYTKYKRKNKIMRILQKRRISINRKKAMGLA